MSNKAYIGTKAKVVETAPRFAAYSKVVLVVTENLEYTAGTDEGRVLTIECPWGTQQIADDILLKIKGFKYQPFSAHGALLDPAAEIGDGVQVKDTYSGIYSLESNFGNLFVSKVAAPSEEEIDHEFPFVESRERKVTRKLNNFSSELQIQANRIAAKVEQTGGSPTSFGWELLSDSWSLKASNKEIFKATKDGINIKGHIVATSGEIGGCSIVDGKLQVPTANITGTITANSLTVKDTSGDALLTAGNNAVKIAGWNADVNSLYSGSSFSSAECFLCTGSASAFNIGNSGYISGWMIKAGSKFGVTKTGAVWCSDIHATGGDVGGWQISNNGLSSNKWQQDSNITETYSMIALTKDALTLVDYDVHDGASYLRANWDWIIQSAWEWANAKGLI